MVWRNAGFHPPLESMAGIWRSDNAGFWRDPFTPLQSAGEDARGPGGLRWRHSPNMPTDSLVVGEYGSTAFYRGQGYRVDSSSEAGD